MNSEEMLALIKKFNKDIEPKINLEDEFTKNGTRESIITALRNIYVNSEIARDDMFNPWIDSGAYAALSAEIIFT